jgi:hypothetical protein
MYCSICAAFTFTNYGTASRILCERCKDGPESLWQKAYSLHYRDEDIDAAGSAYQVVIARYPTREQATWAARQLEIIQSLSEYERKSIDEHRRVSTDFAQARDDQNKTTLVGPKPKRKILPIILSAVGFAIMMAIFKECQREELAQQQAQRANTMITVWMPGPDGQRPFPYWDVEILHRGSDYIRFRTRDGGVIEQHGSFRIETGKRSDY